jgi:chaperonin GroES
MSESKLTISSVLPNKIIIREIKLTEKKTESGLILPSVGKNPQTHGVVLLTGSGTESQPMIIKVGQTVVYTPLSGQRFQLDGEELVLLDQSSVILFYTENL